MRNFYYNLNVVTKEFFGFETKQVRARDSQGNRYQRLDNVSHKKFLYDDLTADEVLQNQIKFFQDF